MKLCGKHSSYVCKATDTTSKQIKECNIFFVVCLFFFYSDKEQTALKKAGGHTVGFEGQQEKDGNSEGDAGRDFGVCRS